MSSITLKSATSLVFTLFWVPCAVRGVHYNIKNSSLLILSDKYRLSLFATISLHVARIITWAVRSGYTALSPQNVSPSHCSLR